MIKYSTNIFFTLLTLIAHQNIFFVVVIVKHTRLPVTFTQNDIVFQAEKKNKVREKKHSHASPRWTQGWESSSSRPSCALTFCSRLASGTCRRRKRRKMNWFCRPDKARTVVVVVSFTLEKLHIFLAAILFCPLEGAVVLTYTYPRLTPLIPQALHTVHYSTDCYHWY